MSTTDEGPLIVATVRLAGVSPAAALTAFTEPAVLARWWRGVEHGPHDGEPGRRAHSEHWDGWAYFLPRLPGALAGARPEDQGP